MNTKKIFSGISALSFLALSSTGAFAKTTIEIKNNGAHSSQEVSVYNQSSIVVDQQSVTNANIAISSSSNTGNNSVNGTTGGGVSVSTGDVHNDTEVHVVGGSNEAHMPAITSNTNDFDVIVTGNGADTDTEVEAGTMVEWFLSHHVSLKAWIDHEIWSNTGHNEADDTTDSGHGDVHIQTGDVQNDTEVVIIGSSNQN